MSSTGSKRAPKGAHRPRLAAGPIREALKDRLLWMRARLD
jgi:hypothetical protein